MAAAAASVDGASGASRNTTVRRPITRSMPGAVVEPVPVPVVSDYTNAIRDREQLVREAHEAKEEAKRLTAEKIAGLFPPIIPRQTPAFTPYVPKPRVISNEIWLLYFMAQLLAVVVIVIGLYKCYLQYFV